LDDLDDLADCGAGGVHDPDVMPFFSQWTDGDRDTVARRVLQRQWSSWGAWTPEDWTLYLVMVDDGTVVGAQSIGAQDYAVTREVVVTAWMGSPYQGRGLGTHGRAAMLALAFEGLEADWVVSVVQQMNEPSQRVAQKLGFALDGTQLNAVRGEQAVSNRYRIDRATWGRHATIPVEISGLEPCLPLFGLREPATATAPSPVRRSNASALSGVQYARDADVADG
jgi:RimJ/RimL family protein N-acetyltransferase